MRYLSIRSIPVFCAILLISVGCKPDNPQGRLALSGTVSVNGVPLETGTISFEPDGAPAVKTSSGASIVKGRYSVPDRLGLVEGDYVVRIYAHAESDKRDPVSGVLLAKSTIPKKYNETSELKITVTKNAKSYDFDLAAAPGDFK